MASDHVEPPIAVSSIQNDIHAALLRNARVIHHWYSTTDA
jgi:hypothetical protein